MYDSTHLDNPNRFAALVQVSKGYGSGLLQVCFLRPGLLHYTTLQAAFLAQAALVIPGAVRADWHTDPGCPVLPPLARADTHVW